MCEEYWRFRLTHDKRPPVLSSVNLSEPGAMPPYVLVG